MNNVFMINEKTFNIYAILKANKGSRSSLINCFLSSKTNEAKLYFQGYIYGDKKSYDYTLYQVATINKYLQIEPKKVYICNGFQAEQKTEYENLDIEQLDLLNQDRVINNKEAIELLFGDRKR